MKALPYLRYSRYSKLGSQDRAGLITSKSKTELTMRSRLSAASTSTPSGFVEPDQERSRFAAGFDSALKLVADGKAGGIIVADLRPL